MLFDDGDANSIDNLLNDLDEVVESHRSSLTSSSFKQPHHDNAQSLFSHSFNQNKTRMFTPHPPSIPKAVVSNSQSPPESTATTIQSVQSQQVLYNPKTRFAVDHHRRQYVDQSSGSAAAAAASTRSDNWIEATEFAPPPAVMVYYDSSSPSPPPLGARAGGGRGDTALNKATTSSSGTGRRCSDGDDEQQQQQRDENSVDRLLNLLSSPTLQRSDSQTDGYSRPVVTTESTIYYSKSHNNNSNKSHNTTTSSSTSSSCSDNTTKTSYFKPSRDTSSSSYSSSDLPSVIAVADSSSSSSYWGVRDRVSSWDEVRTNSSSSETRDRDRDRDSNDSLPHTAVTAAAATTATGYSSGNTPLQMSQRNHSNSHTSLGSLSGTRLGEQQLSVQSTGIAKGFLPDKIGSITATTTSSSTGGSSYGGSSQNSSSKARCIKVVIAGASMERGRKVSSFSKLACSSLRCMKCNFKVLCFIHYSWDSTVDYMFLRNTVPNETKLSQKLLAVSGSSAYCCQCTWVSEAGEKELNPSNPASPQWVCSGH